MSADDETIITLTINTYLVANTKETWNPGHLESRGARGPGTLESMALDILWIYFILDTGLLHFGLSNMI